jgi:RimJ/RimL family protein N-acetyltransferase
MTQQIEDPVLIDVPMPVRTPRLYLRPPQAGDGPALARATAEKWDDLSPWMPWAKDYAANTDPQQREAFLRREQANFIRRDNMMLLGFIEGERDPVIYTGFSDFDWPTRNFTDGYWVPKRAQGNGYATEAANALTRYAFAALEANRVAISFADGNIYSQQVIEKLGFPKEAVIAKHHMLPDGRVVDDHIHALTDTAPLPPLEVSWG